MTSEVSHGRGGAGNIIHDETKYVDGEVVRAGVEGSHEDGAFSAGRGGAGNIGDKGVRRSLERADEEIVPEAAVRPSTDHSDYHTGRGGAGNSHLSPEHEKKKGEEAVAPAAAASSSPPPSSSSAHPTANISVADKLKHKLFGSFGKK